LSPLVATTSKFTLLPLGACPSVETSPVPEVNAMLGAGAASGSPPHEAKKPNAGIASRNNNFSFVYT